MHQMVFSAAKFFTKLQILTIFNIFDTSPDIAVTYHQLLSFIKYCLFLHLQTLKCTPKWWGWDSILIRLSLLITSLYHFLWHNAYLHMNRWVLQALGKLNFLMISLECYEIRQYTITLLYCCNGACQSFLLTRWWLSGTFTIYFTMNT